MKKQKKFGRKLHLNKETISQLTPDKAKKVVGGTGTYGCPSLKPTKCELSVCLYCPCEQLGTSTPTEIC